MENPASSSVPPAPAKASQTGALIWMILSTLLTCLLLGGLAGFIWFATQVGGTPETFNIGMVMLTLPFTNLLFTLAAWIAYVKQKTVPALVLTSLPLALFCLETVVYFGMMTGFIPSP